MPNQPHRDAPHHAMTPIADLAYPMAVLALYTDLPDTPRRASAYDKTVARGLWARGVPLETVESALLLGSLRRCLRPPDRLPLPPIRSLAYFSPVIDELQQQPLPAGYREYLRRKARKVFPPTTVAPEGSPR